MIDVKRILEASTKTTMQYPMEDVSSRKVLNIQSGLLPAERISMSDQIHTTKMGSMNRMYSTTSPRPHKNLR